ncbi:MAG: hypothetical protein GXY40_00365 [Syntrophomonadaceae bacterium]|nr:hypothetical protein [Syntrophomonadaceae bacterium]
MADAGQQLKSCFQAGEYDMRPIRQNSVILATLLRDVAAEFLKQRT